MTQRPTPFLFVGSIHPLILMSFKRFKRFKRILQTPRPASTGIGMGKLNLRPGGDDER
jgi:hypothetical protein